MTDIRAARAYIGIKPCGCVTAILFDDEKTRAKDVADFARSMQRTGRAMENVPLAEGRKRLALCGHPKRAV